MLSLRTIARRAPAFALATSLFVSALGAPDPASAQDPIIRDHRLGPQVARVQVILNHVKILDDHDPGAGELRFGFTMVCIQTSAPCPGGASGADLDHMEESFNASTNEIHAFNRALPDGKPNNPNGRYPASAEAGYPLYPGHSYLVSMWISESDSFSDNDSLGELWFDMRPENRWGIGEHTIRSSHGLPINSGNGDFEITFEVRPMPLPDLRPVNILVSDLPGSTKKRVCIPVQNIEPTPAGPFEVGLLIDDQAPVDARTTVAGLANGSHTDACVEAALPTSGQHKLKAVVGLGNGMVEYNDANNTYEQVYTAPAPAVSTPTAQESTGKSVPTVSVAQADLTVSAIKVNGQVPDGKDDCKDGKNAVAVVVKNGGTEKAGAFAVRLDADGAQVAEQAVSGLEAGQEREVRFGDVRLKQGERKLAATVDPMNPLDETGADNNERTVTAQCKDAN